MRALVAGLIGLPLSAAALALALRHAHPSTARRLALTATGLTALCALALLPHAGDAPAIAVEWLPGAGPMRLTAGAAGLYTALATTWAAFLALLGTAPRSGERPPLSEAVTLLALAAANAAFLAEHFLARYAALEVVALCIALAPLVEMGGSKGIRHAWNSYLFLRLGDAGLLAAILMLMVAGGTLDIGPALEAGGTLDATRLGAVVAGFVLAVWVKLGGWPFHLWSQPGRRLSLASQSWLYATVMPNLGLYLLYRITPLLALASPLQNAALWLGAGGAAIGALMALTQTDLRAALVYLGAAQGGLALFVAASGVKPAVWLSLLALTPPRLLLFLAADAAANADSRIRCRVAAGLFALGGLALTIFGLLTTHWAWEAGAPLDALLVAEAAVALTGVWAANAAQELSRRPPRLAVGAAPHRARWATMGLLATVVLVGGVAFGPLVRRLAAAGGMAPPATPTLPALLRHTATSPALLGVMALALAVWRLRRRSKLLVSARPEEEVYDLEEALARAAQALHAVVEVGIAEGLIALVARAVVDGARVTHRVVEHKSLEGLLRLSARAVVGGSHIAYRVVEQEGLEGLLRRAVRAALVLSRGLQRWHTGRLRHNLLWVAASLVLAVLALVLGAGGSKPPSQ